MRSLHHSCLILLKEVKKYGLKVKPELLIPSTTPLPEYTDNERQGELLLTPYYSLALKYMLDDASLWIRALVNKPCKPDWYVIDTCFEQLGSAGIDGLRVARSRSQALSLALEHMIFYRFFPTRVDVSDEGNMLFENENDETVRVSQIKFLPVNSYDSRVITRAFKNLYWQHSVDKISQRFDKIAGAGTLVTNRMEDYTHQHQPIEYSCNTIANQIKQFVEEVCDSQIKLSAAQQLCVHFFGVTDWNYLKKLEKDYSENLKLPFALFIDRQSGRPETLSFHQGFSAGVLGFKKRLYKLKGKSFEISNHVLASVYSKSAGNTDIQVEQLILQELQCDKTESKYDKDALELINFTDFPAAVIKYFSSNKSSQQRIIDVNSKRGGAPEDHLFCGNWFFWIEQGQRFQYLHVEKFEGNVTKKHKCSSFQRMKAAIVLNPEDKKYWMATDWDRKPTFSLMGLSVEDLIQIEKKFIDKSVWLLAEKPKSHEHFYQGYQEEIGFL